MSVRDDGDGSNPSGALRRPIPGRNRRRSRESRFGSPTAGTCYTLNSLLRQSPTDGTVIHTLRSRDRRRVGATDREGAVGRAILENLKAGFDGEVVPINPSRDEVLGLECYEDVQHAPPIDLAVVVVPPDIVLDSIRELAAAGTDDIVVITAGFAETGGDGAKRERQLREIATENDLNVVGPNSLGIMSTPTGMNATFGLRTPVRVRSPL